MGYNFLPYDQDQLYLLPPSINEWVPEGSLPRFVDEVVETLDMNGRLQIQKSGSGDARLTLQSEGLLDRL